MKNIKSIDDIQYKVFKEHQEVFFDYHNASTESIIDAFKAIYEVNDETMSKLSTVELFAYIHNIITLINETDIELVTKLKQNGIVYGFIPSFGEITTGELIDLDNRLKDQDWFSIASILYRPITKEEKNGRYLIEEYKGFDPQLFEDASIRFYIGFINFFYKSFHYLNQSILSSTPQEKMTKMKKK